MPSVELINVTVGYGRKPPIFEKISVSLTSRGGEGKVIAIVGRSGSGKSSLLRAILGLDAPRAGQITTEPKNAQFAFLSQDPIVLEHFSIRDNVYHFERIGATARRIKRTNVEQLSLKLGMRDLVESTQKVSQLSGGEKQRVALLRALSVEPDVLCLDEPCSGLDVSVKREFLIGLRTAVQARSILTLYVTHHADEALMIADEVFFIDRESNAPGQLWVGTVPSFLSKPPVIAIRRFFGGATLNTLRCTIVDGSIRVKGSRAELAHLNESISCSECLITFLPEAVEFSVDGVSVDILGRSEWFTFFEVSKSLPSATLIGPRMEKNLSAIRLNGEVAIFDTSGKWIQRAIAV